MVLAEAATALLRAYYGVRFQPFQRVADRLALPVERVASAIEATRAQEVRSAIHGVCRRLPLRPACLVRAVAAQGMLARRGVCSTLVLSVAPVQGSMPVSAHAWLEAAGTVVTGRSEMEHFTPIFRIGNSPAVSVAEGAARCSP